MNKTVVIVAFVATALSAAVQAQERLPETGGTYREILSSFSDPPADCRPRVWWHWMDGNISKDGIRKDMLWMKDAGVGGVQVFDAGLSVPAAVPERVTFMSPEWKDAFGYATRLADSLGFEMAIVSSGGWSDTGGPWVTPEESMKTLNWKEMTVEGGRHIETALPEPNVICGKYLTHSFYSAHRPEFDYYRDIAVMAVKIPEWDLSMEELGVKVTASDGSDMSGLMDGDLNNVCLVQAGSSGSDEPWIQFEFPEPVTIRSYFFARKDDYRSRHWEWYFSMDGETWECPGTLVPLGECIPSMENIPFVTVDWYPNTARYFLVRSHYKDVPLDFTEFRLFPDTRVQFDTEKAGFFVNPALRNLYPTPAYEFATAPEDVIDLTDRCHDGVLDWNAPEGRWRIYRFGYTIRGRRNNPASPEATGLEIDKLDPEVTSRYYHTYFDMMNDASGGALGKRISHLMVDSFEAGCQTWTAGMEDEFEKRRGYALRPWLPALAGHIIGSSEATDRFLLDWRQTLGEMLTEYHYDALDPILEEYGLKRYTEFHESGRAFPVDGMEIKRNADIPMGAVWTSPDSLAAVRYMSDIRESASVAHIFGQNVVAAESFTTDGTMTPGDRTLRGLVPSGHGPRMSWDMFPSQAKGAADLAFASGLNSVVIHCSVHQPVDDKVPGISLGQYGMWFTRHDTWSHEARLWTDYLARSSYLLRQGCFVADVAYFISETTNVSDRFRTTEPVIGRGYAYDYVNRRALAMPQFGYKALIIDPEVDAMSLEALESLSRLAEKGVIIAGAEPDTYLGLNGFERSCSRAEVQERFDDLVRNIWHSGRSNVMPYGRMRGFWSGDPSIRGYREISSDAFSAAAQALAAGGVTPDVIYQGADDAVKDLRFVHRHLSDGELYFVTSASSSPKTLTASFRVCGRRPVLMHADTGVTEDVPYRMVEGRTEVPLRLNARDAVFVLFCEETSARCVTVPVMRESGVLAALQGEWTVRFQEGRGAPEQISLDTLRSLSGHDAPGVKYFSGTATYSTGIKVDRLRRGRRYILSLGTVHSIARVRVNGVDCGAAWKVPFEVDVTGALRKGLNLIEVDVTNAWTNRIIGDAVAARDGSGAVPVTWTSHHVLKAEDELHPSGLLGPVRLEVR